MLHSILGSVMLHTDRGSMLHTKPCAVMLHTNLGSVKLHTTQNTIMVFYSPTCISVMLPIGYLHRAASYPLRLFGHIDSIKLKIYFIKILVWILLYNLFPKGQQATINTAKYGCISIEVTMCDRTHFL